MKDSDNKSTPEKQKVDDKTIIKNAIINILNKPNSINVNEFSNQITVIENHYSRDDREENTRFRQELKQLQKSLDSANGLFKNSKLKRAGDQFAYDPSQLKSLQNPKPKSLLGYVLDSVKEKILPKDKTLDSRHIDLDVSKYSYGKLKKIVDKYNEYSMPNQTQRADIAIEQEKVKTVAEANRSAAISNNDKIKNMTTDLQKSSNAAPQVSSKINNKNKAESKGRF